MDIEYDVMIRAKIKCDWGDEEDAFEWLQASGYKIETINHRAEYIYLTGIKKLFQKEK